MTAWLRGVYLLHSLCHRVLVMCPNISMWLFPKALCSTKIIFAVLVVSLIILLNCKCFNYLIAGIITRRTIYHHLPNCMWYAVWFGVCICWCTAPLCSEIWIGEEVLSLHHTIRHDLLPKRRDSEILSRLRRHSVYPIPLTNTNKYRPFIHYALAKYQ